MSIEAHDERFCRNCRYFNINADKPTRSGTCRAHPPVPIDADKDYHFEWCFPEVWETFWCGEWAPRRSPRQ